MTTGESELVARAFSGLTGQAIQKALKFRIDYRIKRGMSTEEEREWRNNKAAVEELLWVTRLGARAGQDVVEEK